MKDFAHFEFAGELNYFLNDKRKNIVFQHFFDRNSTVKDNIQALGVPHTEVEWIVVNGVSVDFNYRILAQDDIKVYPTSSALKLPILVRPPLPKRIFIVDFNVRKMAKYLRMFGFDTITDEGVPDKEIVAIAEQQNRIILSRDIGLLKRKNAVFGIFLQSENVEDQMIEAIIRYNLLAHFQPFTLCLECNGEIALQDKSHIGHLVSEDILNDYHEFYQCKVCQKVYWKGSHYDKMVKRIELLKNSLSRS
jgi:uncharacterized protein with PIN domain